VAAWTSGAVITVVAGLWWLRPTWSPVEVRLWARRTRRVAGGFLSDFLITTGAQQATFLLLPAVTSLSVVAAVRTAQVVNGPLTVLLGATAIIVLPAVARRRDSGDLAGAMRDARRTSVGLVAVSGAYLVFLVLVLLRWGDSLLGEQWDNGRAIVPLICLQMALMGVSQGPVLLLRGWSLVKALVLTRLVVTPTNVAGPLVGAHLGGAGGAAWGMVASASIAAMSWWLAVHVLSRSRRP